MVRVEFPVKLLEPEFLECLIRERPEDFVTKARITKAQKDEKFHHLFSTEGAYAIYKNGGRGEKISEFLDSIGLEERETLNGIALPGSCQFSCLADQLFGRECTRDWRADVLLRELAMFVIATNEDQFRCFMLHANPRTRSQNRAAGESVDLEAYIHKMQKSSTDGDHLTLQALCDALQCPIHVLQVVDSPLAAHVIAQHDFKNVVINELHPRVLPHLHKFMSRLQVQRRELWLTLHGEAHFKSLHVSSYTEEEASAATAELQVLQSTMPDPPPTPTLPNVPSSSSSSSSVTTAAGQGSPQADTAPQAQSIDTCSICLEDVETDRRSLGTTGKAPSPVSAENPRGGRMQTRGGPEVPAKPDSCTHVFHYGCLCSWALLSSSCPNCKARFAAIDRLWGGRKTTVIHGKKGARNRLTEVSSTEISRSRVEEEDAEDEDDPNDPIRCYVCNRANNSNVLLLCDNYPRCLNSAHTWCLGLDNVPHGDWFCPSCQRARSASVSNSDSTAAPTRRPDRAERARRRRLAAEAAERGVADSSSDRGGDDGTTMRRVRTAGGEQEARRRQRVNVLAREIQDRHAENGITSTEPWARVLEAAHEAEQRVRVANGENGVVVVARPAVGRRTPVQTEQQAPVIDVEQEQLLQAFADREAALRLASQQQQAQAAAAAAGPSRSRSVYEISSDSDDGSGDMTARTASSRSSHHRGGRGRGGGAMPNGVHTARAHTRPITLKRPRLAEAPLPFSASTSRLHTFLPPPSISSSSLPPPPLSSSSSSSSSPAAAGSGGVRADGGLASNAMSTTDTSCTQAPRAASPPPQPLNAKDPKNVLGRLEAAVEADVSSVASGWPPTEMAKLTGELSAIFSWDQRDQARLLNLGLLTVLRRFLEPIPGRPSFLPLHSKMVILRLLQALPIGMAHLRESGLNRVLLLVCTQPGEDKTVRDLVQGLISNWARFVFNVKLNGAASEIHKGRWHSRTSPRSPPAYRPTHKAPHSSASSSSTSSAAAAGAAGVGHHQGGTGVSHGLSGFHHGGGGSGAGGGLHVPSSSSSSSLSVSGIPGGGKAPSYVTPYVPVTDPSRLFGAQKDSAFALPTFRM